MKQISLHILDIAENSIQADAQRISIEIIEEQKKNLLTIRITDDGKGMEAEMIKQITDPFTTSRTTRRVGLGIPFFKAAAEACNGHFSINSTPGKGTDVETTFELDHIDRMPMGDIEATFLQLLIGNPDTDWLFTYRNNVDTFELDSAPIKETLDGIPFSDPTVLKYLKETLNDGISNIKTIH